MYLKLLCLIVVVTVGCKKSDTTTSKKEGTVDQPTEVAGGFGLTMQCSVTNKDLPNATSSDVACLVNNDDGTKYTGTFKNLKAAVTAKNADGRIIATPVIAPTSSSVSIGVTIPGLKPDDAISIEISGAFDDKPAVLTATLRGRLAVICDEDIDYYVDYNASESQIYCTQGNPCKTIGQALALIPDVIACNISVNIAPGSYAEKLDLSGRTLKQNKKILLRGLAPVNQVNNVKLVPPPNLEPVGDDPFTGRNGGRIAITLTSLLSSNAWVEIHDLQILGGAEVEKPANGKNIYEISHEMSGKFDTGIEATTTALKLSNVILTGFSRYAILARDSSRVSIFNSAQDPTSPAMSIKSSRTGIYSIDADMVILNNKIVVNGNADLDDGAGIYSKRSTLKILDGTAITVKDLAYGVVMQDALTAIDDRSANIDIENVFVGLHLEDSSEFNWTPVIYPSSKNKPQPSLKIKGCALVCVYLSNSKLTLENEAADPDAVDPKKRLIFSLEAKLPDQASSVAHYGLIRARYNSRANFSYLANNWCNLGNYSNEWEYLPGGGYSRNYFALTIESGSTFKLSKFKAGFEAVPVSCKNAGGYIAQSIKNYESLATTGASCPANSVARENFPGYCLSNLGSSQLYIKTSDSLQMIGTEQQIDNLF